MSPLKSAGSVDSVAECADLFRRMSCGRVISEVELVEIRRSGKWLVYNTDGERAISLKYRGSRLMVPCNVVSENEISYMMSYRWKGVDGSAHVEGDVPLAFAKDLPARTNFWVDYLNHCDIPHLKMDVISKMGLLYAHLPTYAKYLEDYESTPSGHRTFMLELTRGWIWQELAFSTPPPICKKSQNINLLVELVQGGSEIIRTLLPSGFSPPIDMGVDDIVQFAIDCLWRVRGGGSDQVGIKIFTQQSPQIKSKFVEATARVRQLRSKLGPARVARALAALDNLENGNYTNVADMFDASFSTYKQLFGLDDKALQAYISNDLPLETKKLGLEYEIWQRPVTKHPLSFLLGVHASMARITSWEDVTLTVLGRTYALKFSYTCSVLNGLDDPDMGVLIGQNLEVQSANYRVSQGRTYMVGVNLVNHLRLVLVGSLEVTGGRCALSRVESQWSSAAWQSGDSEWARFIAWREGL